MNQESGKFNVGCLVAVLVVGALVVGGVVFLGKFGLDAIADQVADDIRDNAVIREHIGEIEEISVDLSASGAIEDEETFVFDLVGSKGSGTLIARIVTVDAETERVTSGTLKMESGETHDLFP